MPSVFAFRTSRQNQFVGFTTTLVVARNLCQFLNSIMLIEQSSLLPFRKAPQIRTLEFVGRTMLVPSPRRTLE